MKKRYFAIAVFLLSALLSGCGDMSKPLEFYVKGDSGVAVWGVENDQLGSDELMLEETPQLEPELPDVELEADIVGLYEVLQSGQLSGNVSSVLSVDKEYEVWARVVLTSSADEILGQELDFLLRCPTVVKADKKSNFAVQLLANGSVLDGREFAVTSTAYDLRLDYIPETYSICQGNIDLTVQDVIWYENPKLQEQTLDYFIKVDQSFKVYEYTLKYRVKTSMLDGQQETANEQAQNPISMELKGISHILSSDEGEQNDIIAQYVLLDCFRDNYMFPESIGCAGSIYLVSEVTLPDWARDYAIENGLIVTWYHYENDIGCGVGLSLPNFPENLGHHEVNLHNLVLNTLVYVDEPNAIGILVDYPVSPLSIWRQRDDGGFELINLAQMPTESTEVNSERKSYSYLLDGESCASLPSGEKFYLVLGTEMTYYTNPIE